MTISKYLSKGVSKGYVLAISGYAINMDFDGSLVLAEPTHLPDGYYDFEENQVDERVQTFLNSIWNQNVPFFTEDISAKNYVKLMIVDYMDAKELYSIRDLPNITKGIADGLQKANETMTFSQVSKDEYEFTCFGTRPTIAKYLESSVISYVNISPLSYYYATNYKSEMTFEIRAYSLLTKGKNGNRAMILNTDVEMLSKYRTGEEIPEEEKSVRVADNE